jgi:hypothetical protein
VKELIVEVCHAFGGAHPSSPHVHLPAPQPPAQENVHCPVHGVSVPHDDPDCKPAPAPEEAEDKYLAGRVTLSEVHAAVPKPAPAPETKGERWTLTLHRETRTVCRSSFDGIDCQEPHRTHGVVAVVPESRVAEARKQAVEETLREVVKGMEFEEMQILRATGHVAKGSIWVREFAREKLGVEL